MAAYIQMTQVARESSSALLMAYPTRNITVYAPGGLTKLD